ncbi:MAG: hypothetical protein IJX19_09555 [Clostridia bacterium]|nr:hypothetical protein [Clostridia bacterium]
MHLLIDFENRLGPIKPMHSVGQPPINATNLSLCRYLQEAHIPYARLHDVGGPYGGSRYVDVHNIFPDFDADENDPASYDFEFTDHLLREMEKYGLKPIYRLGETIENTVKHGFRPRYINPPKDFHKWARICEHIIRHYNQGWANGFYYGIEYWEIWNEPEHGPVVDGERELSPMWTGTPEEFYEFYTVAAKHLKQCFGDSIKVGGYSCCGLHAIMGDPVKYGVRGDVRKDHEEEWYLRPRCEFVMQFFLDFLAYVKKENAPLDFFSWHSYDSVEAMAESVKFVTRTLKEYGFDHTERHLNEWNTARMPLQRGTSFASATAAAVLLAMQDTELDMLNFYDSRVGISRYGGIFNPLTMGVLCTYYSFGAFGELYALGTQVSLSGTQRGVWGAAATNGEAQAVMLSNISGEAKEITTNLEDGFEIYLVDQDHPMTRVDLSPKSFTLENNQVALLKRG